MLLVFLDIWNFVVNIGVVLMYFYLGNSIIVLCLILKEKNIFGEMKKYIYILINIWDIGLCFSFSINFIKLFIGDYVCLRNKF